MKLGNTHNTSLENKIQKVLALINPSGAFSTGVTQFVENSFVERSSVERGSSTLLLSTKTEDRTREDQRPEDQLGQYVLSTPAMLVSGNTGRVCINIVGSTEPLDVSVSLEHDGKNTSIIAEDVAPPKYFQCSDFEVPSVRNAVPVAIMFSAIGSNTAIRERKTVVINIASDNCMFQMDKPMYKPGNKVFFRVICLNSQLKPMTQKFPSIYLQVSNTALAIWVTCIGMA